MMQTSWDILLREQVQRDFKNYMTITLDLGQARTNQAYPVPGDCLYVNSVSSPSAAAAVRFGRNTNEPVDLKLHTKIKTVFTSFFVTNAAQPGEALELLVGINFEVSNIQKQPAGEAQPAFIVTYASPNINTVAASHICNRALIRAHSSNTGIAWVNFGAAAAAAGCYELTAGDAIAVSLSNTDKINVLFTVANEKVTVIYEV